MKTQELMPKMYFIWFYPFNFLSIRITLNIYVLKHVSLWIQNRILLNCAFEIPTAAHVLVHARRDAVFDFLFIIKVIAMTPFPLNYWLNSEYFEYRQRSNRFTTKKVTGFLKKSFTTFLGKTETYARLRYVYQYFFLFSSTYILC